MNYLSDKQIMHYLEQYGFEWDIYERAWCLYDIEGRGIKENESVTAHIVNNYSTLLLKFSMYDKYDTEELSWNKTVAIPDVYASQSSSDCYGFIEWIDAEIEKFVRENQ